MLCKVTHCAGCVSAITRPYQLHGGDREIGTAVKIQLGGWPYLYSKYSGSTLTFPALSYPEYSFIRINCEFRLVQDPHIIEYKQSACDWLVSSDFTLINAHCVSTRTSLVEVLC